jgi:hypothetical protein
MYIDRTIFQQFNFSVIRVLHCASLSLSPSLSLSLMRYCILLIGILQLVFVNRHKR